MNVFTASRYLLIGILSLQVIACDNISSANSTNESARLTKVQVWSNDLAIDLSNTNEAILKNRERFYSVEEYPVIFYSALSGHLQKLGYKLELVSSKSDADLTLNFYQIQLFQPDTGGDGLEHPADSLESLSDLLELGTPPPEGGYTFRSPWVSGSIDSAGAGKLTGKINVVISRGLILQDLYTHAMLSNTSFLETFEEFSDGNDRVAVSTEDDQINFMRFNEFFESQINLEKTPEYDASLAYVISNDKYTRTPVEFVVNAALAEIVKTSSFTGDPDIDGPPAAVLSVKGMLRACTARATQIYALLYPKLLSELVLAEDQKSSVAYSGNPKNMSIGYFDLYADILESRTIPDTIRQKYGESATGFEGLLRWNTAQDGLVIDEEGMPVVCRGHGKPF